MKILTLPEPSARKLASVQALATYGISRSEAIYIMNNFWCIKEVDYRKIFVEYFLLRWEKKYFDTVFKEGIITRAGSNYSVIYYRTDPIKLKKHTGGLLLSFRTVDPIYNIQPTVLVTLA